MKTKTVKLKSSHHAGVVSACVLCDLNWLCKHGKVDCELELDEYWEIDEDSL